MSFTHGLMLLNLGLMGVGILPCIALVVFRTGRAAEVLRRADARLERHSSRIGVVESALARIDANVEIILDRIKRLEQ